MKRRKATQIGAIVFFIVNTFLINLLCFSQSYVIEGEYDVYGTNPGGTLYGGTVTIEKSGNAYNFNWSVGESYSGTGSLQGNTLTVEWGDDYPVIYTVKEGGRLLIGTWSNGQATETLCRQGNVYKGVKVSGTYEVVGTNTDGSVYKGTVTITQTGDSYNFSWNVGESYSGKGHLSGEELTVEWEAESPVIYEVREGGNVLIGTWADGKATEILSR
jgi:hypothetical protein